MALVSVDNQVLISNILNATLERIEFAETQKRLPQAQEVLLQVARHMEPVDLVQRE